MKFQYISDIHLEHGNVINIQPVADNLILAGDIGDPVTSIYREFLRDVSSKFQNVFLIAGNHEYYSIVRTIEETDILIRTITQTFPNVYYLQNDFYHINHNLTIFGSTMWTTIDPIEEFDVLYCINDYRRIPQLTIEKCNFLHKKSVSALEEIISNNSNRKFIVITHHIPQKRLINPKYYGFPFNSAYAADIPVIDKECVAAVVYGHTHTPSQIGKYYCNPVGYPGENKIQNTVAIFDV